MSQTEAFVIPQGLHFEHTSQGLVIEHQGDIILRGSLGSNVHRLISTDGNIHIERPLTTGEISALNGRVSSDSPLTASRISAKQLEVANDLTVHKQVHVSKSLHVHGDIQSSRIQCLGSMEVTGSVSCDEFYAEGVVSILNNLHSSNIEAQGTISIVGSVNCTTITLGNEQANFGSLTAQVAHASETELTLTQGGNVPALHVRDLISTGKLECKTIQSSNTIQLMDGEVHSDVVFCEHFNVVGQVAGKILVLEASTQTGAHHIKGCLELSDFAELVPNIDAFLSERGLVAPTSHSTILASENIMDRKHETATEDRGALHVNLNSVVATQSISEEKAPVYHEDPDQLPETDDIEDTETQPARIAVPLVESSEEENDGPTSEDSEEHSSSEDEINIEETTFTAEPEKSAITTNLDADEMIFENDSNFTELNDEVQVDEESIEDVSAEVVIEESHKSEANTDESTENNPLFDDIREKIHTLASAYEEHPEGIIELMTFLESNDFITLREDLKPIWSSLMKFHQQENSRIPPMALQAFTKLDKLLKNL